MTFRCLTFISLSCHASHKRDLHFPIYSEIVSKTSAALHSPALSDPHTFAGAHISHWHEIIQVWSHNSSETPNGTCKNSSTDGTHQSTRYKLCDSPTCHGCEIHSALVPSFPAHGTLPCGSLYPEGYLTGLQDLQLLHPHTHFPGANRECLLLPSLQGSSCISQKFFYYATTTLGLTKAVTPQTSLGFKGSLSPHGQEANKTSSYMGIHVPFGCQNKYRLKPKCRVLQTLVGLR